MKMLVEYIKITNIKASVNDKLNNLRAGVLFLAGYKVEKKTEEKEQSERARNMDWAFFPITTQDFGLLQLYVYRKKIQITLCIN